MTAILLHWTWSHVTKQHGSEYTLFHAWQSECCLCTASCIVRAHLAAGLAAAETGGAGAAGRGRAPPPAGKPGEGLAPGTGAPGRSPCADM